MVRTPIRITNPSTKLDRQLASSHTVQWRTASPLWRELGREIGQETNRTLALSQPAILRFTTDSFMEDFLKVATTAPQRLGEWQVTRETWRLPAPIPVLPPGVPSIPTEAAETELDPDLAELQEKPIKLFQSAHQRFYLVSANLVCRTPGFPDRTLKTNNEEKVSFVIRRYFSAEGEGDKADPSQALEHAFVDGEWQPLSADQQQLLIPGEEQIPMFPTTYTQESNYQRRLFSGLIPVSARERYMNAARKESSSTQESSTAPTDIDFSANINRANSANNPLSETEKRDQLMTVFAMDVIQPWRAIVKQCELQLKKLTESHSQIDNVSAAVEAVKNTRDSLQTASWYILLDFAYFLKRYCPLVWQQIETNPNGNFVGTVANANLFNLLKGRKYLRYSGNANSLNEFNQILTGVENFNPSTEGISLTSALKAVYTQKAILENATGTYSEGAPTDEIGDWPSTKFLLCAAKVTSLVTLPASEGSVSILETRIRQALAADPSTLQKRIPLIPISQQISATAQNEDYQEDRFIIRCIFERPHCPPSVQPTVVSAPTQSFQMASYFDPDAPSRPIRIPMPVDTSPAGLRKFAKNTAFVLSDSLSCQIEKAGSLTFGDLVLSVLPWPFRKKLDTSGASCSKQKGLSIGKICTLSIPIITICALILLLIIVQLLDIIFRWVPYLIFCLPLPGLKSKGGEA